MAHDGLGTDVPFLHQEVEIQQLALAAAHFGFEEQAGVAEIANAGNIAVGVGFPVDPKVIVDQDARSFPAGGAGCDLKRAHRLHPRPRIAAFDGLPRASRDRGEILPKD